MTQNCRPAKCIEAIRVTLLDQCTLQPVCGPLNGYAMGCIIEPNWTPEIEEGEESIVKDNCGNICLRDDRCDLVKRWNLEFKIKDPDKEFLALIEGNPLIVDGDGNSIGVRQLAYGACSPYVFLELFERTDDCQVDGDPVYLRHVFPAVRLKWTGNEHEGVFRILQIEGKTRPVITDNVDTGPYFDIPSSVFVGSTTSETVDYVWFEDDFLPTVQCGAINVPCPPRFASVDAEDDCTVCAHGTGLTNAATIEFTGTINPFYTFYNPANFPDLVNSLDTIVVSWTDTDVCIQYPFTDGDQLTLATAYDINNNVVDTLALAPGIDVGCIDPPVIAVESNSPCTVTMTGFNTDEIDSVAISTGGPAVSYYQPTSPNFGDNPVGAVIVQWTDTTIEISDPNLCGECVETVQMFWVNDSGEEASLGITTLDPCVPVQAAP